jgi:hypothetical protein
MRLTPKTQKGRNRIREIGTDRCFVVTRAADLPIGRGPWIFVHFERTDDRHDRWVHAKNDTDFAIEK